MRALDFFQDEHMLQRNYLFRISNGTVHILKENSSIININNDIDIIIANIIQHSSWEDNLIQSILEDKDPPVASNLLNQHVNVKRKINQLQEHFNTALKSNTAEHIFTFYQNFNVFIAEYLLHIHFEETIVAGSLEANCSKPELLGLWLAYLATVQDTNKISASKEIILSTPKDEINIAINTIKSYATEATQEQVKKLFTLEF